MRAYHYSFPTRRSWEHILIALAVIVVPIILLISFSYVSGIHVRHLFDDIGVSIYRLVIAYFAAAALAWLGAVFLASGRTGEFLLPLFDVLQSMPSFAILPIAILYWGRSEVTIVFFLVLAIIWPILFATMSSIKQADRDWHAAAQMSRIHGLEYLRYYLVPLSLPGFITGCIIGIGEGWEALIATEIIVNAQSGLGAFFSSVANDPTLTAFGVLIFLSLIFAVNKLIWLPLLDWSHRLAA